MKLQVILTSLRSAAITPIPPQLSTTPASRYRSMITVYSDTQLDAATASISSYQTALHASGFGATNLLLLPVRISGLFLVAK